MKAQEKDAKRLFGTHTHTHTHSISVRCRHPLSMPLQPDYVCPTVRKERAQNKSRSEQITRVVFSASFPGRTWANGRMGGGQQLHFPNWTTSLTHSRTTSMWTLVFYSSAQSPWSKMCVQLRTMVQGIEHTHTHSLYFSPSLSLSLFISLGSPLKHLCNRLEILICSPQKLHKCVCWNLPLTKRCSCCK